MSSESNECMSEPSTSQGESKRSDDKVILKWSRSKLKGILTDLVMYCFAEASSQEVPKPLPKEISTFLRELDTLLPQISNLSGFLSTLLHVMRQHSQRVDRVYGDFIGKECCAPDCTNAVQAFVTYTGPGYKPRALVLDSTASEDETLYFCVAHYFVADRLYSLVHMRWNIMLNAQHRIAKKPTLLHELNREASVVTNLVDYYMYLISDFSPSSTNQRPLKMNSILKKFYICAEKWEKLAMLT